MEWLKRNSLFGAVLFIAALLAMEGSLWARHRAQARRALAVLERKAEERDRLARQSPAPTIENERAIARDLADAQKMLAAWWAARREREGGAPVAPPERVVDFFFDLAAFVEKTRALAAHAGVSMKPDERFGFATHAKEGPAAELVPAVFRQRMVAQQLLEALLGARPQSLLAVQRERPLSAAQRDLRHLSPSDEVPALTGGKPEDFFALDPALSVRVPGQVDSDAFRVEFTGQTPALREFLNSLVRLTPPVIIRSVEVEPLAGEMPDKMPAASTGTPAPLVARNVSRFAVVVEAIRPADPAGEPES